MHLAAVLIPVCQADPVKGGLTNVIGTLNVFEGARDAGREVRVVYASSSAVWGPEEAYGDRALSESDLLLPATHYGVFKQANEGNARAFYCLNGISSVGLRPWSVYGLGRDAGLTADPTLAEKAVVLRRPFRIPDRGGWTCNTWRTSPTRLFRRCSRRSKARTCSTSRAKSSIWRI